jgi:hypothetical protein
MLSGFGDGHTFDAQSSCELCVERHADDINVQVDILKGGKIVSSIL